MRLDLTLWLLIGGIVCASANKVLCENDRCNLEYSEWVGKVANGLLNAKDLANCLKAKVVAPLRNRKNVFLIRTKKPRSSKKSRYTELCKHKSYVIWIEEQAPKFRAKRDFSGPVNWNDPLYSDMWYITRARQNAGHDMNVHEAWQLNYTGKGVVLTIMDDGVDYSHTDLKRNYDPLASYDLIDDDPDPMPNLNMTESNKHGTRCAGQIAAEGNNSVCVVGVAYNSRIGGIRMLNLHITDNLESEALAFRNDYIHIYSGSWGPEDTGKMYEGPGVLAQSAFQEGIVSGRHGLGSIYVWAAGNGGETDSCACDGYASSMFTLSVNSVGEHNSRPSYLEECSSTLATTYSSGGPSEKMVATIDPHQQCTTAHTGTSASAPMAAGIIALLLEANPRLSWRDVQYITLLTANPRPFVDGNFTRNAAGRSYSSLYGYGLMDAGKMVRLGELWRGLPAHHRCTSRIGNVSIKLEGRFNHTFELNFTGCFPLRRSEGQTYAAYSRNASEQGSAVRYLEHVQLYADIFYQRRGVLQITVISPSGTESVLQPPRVHDDHSGNIGLLRWPLTTVQLWGESALGVWRIRLDNLAESRLPQSKRPDLNKLKGYWRAVWLVVYGTDEFPIRLRPPKPERPPPADWFNAFSTYVVDDSEWHKVYTCHVECAPGGCTGPRADQCLGGCRHFATEFRECVSTCPPGTTPYGGLRISLPTRDEPWPTSPWHRTRINKPGRSNALSVPGATVVCQPCWTLCAACVRPHTEYDCTACASGQYLVPLIVPARTTDTSTNYLNPNWRILDVALPRVAGICRSDCPPGFFINKAANTCEKCIEHCSSCNGSRVGQCMLCKPGFRLLLGRCVDGNSVDGHCGHGQYLHLSQCRDCHSACEPSGCLPDGQCYKCTMEHPYLLNGVCVKTCPSGWYPGLRLAEPFVTTQLQTSGDLQSVHLRLCEPCPPGCRACRSAHVCDLCLQGLIPWNGLCTNRSSFRRCGSRCETCIQESFDCLSCPSSHFLIPKLFWEQSNNKQVVRLKPENMTSTGSTLLSYTCTNHCTQGTYPDKSGTVCLPCPPSCADCSDESHCFTCRSPFYLDDKNASCVLGRACRQSEFFDPRRKMCVPCHYDCATCAGPLASDCTSCSIHGSSPRCLNSRTANSILAKSDASILQRGQCVPCCAYKLVLLNRAPTNCMFCAADRVNCLMGNEINAGEGLVIEQTPDFEESPHDWLIREPFRLVLLVLCCMVFVAALIFIMIHAIRMCQQRRTAATAMASIRRRRLLLKQSSLTDLNHDGDNGVRQALTSEDGRPNLSDLSDCEHSAIRGNSTMRQAPTKRSNQTSAVDRHVLYTPLRVNDKKVDDNHDYDYSDSLAPACTTHLSNEFCARSVQLPSSSEPTCTPPNPF